MKALISINFYLQAVIAATCLIGFFEFDMLILEALALGFTQMVFSFLFLIAKGGKSKLKYHFLLGAAYLGVLYFDLLNQTLLTSTSFTSSDPIYWIVPSALCLYYWYKTFVHLNPFTVSNHHVLDL